MEHVFEELNPGMEKRADVQQPQPSADLAAPASPPMDAGLVPPGQAGVPQHQQGQQPWVGPKVGAFPNRRMTLNMRDHNAVMAAALEAVVNEFDYLSQLPMEPRIDKDEGNIIVGSVMIATPQQRNVAVPFVVNDGTLEPPVAVAIDGEYYAIPTTEMGFSHLVGAPAPVIGASSNKKLMPTQQTAPDQENIAKGPDGGNIDNSANNSRRAVLGELPKQASLLDYLSGTPFGRKVSDLLAVPEEVVQFERVPFGVMEKTAYAGDFRPAVRELPVGKVPAAVMDAFSRKPFATIVRDPGVFELEKQAARTVTLYERGELRPGMGIKASQNGNKFNMRVLKQIGWGDDDPERLVATSSKGVIYRLTEHPTTKYVKGRAPAIKMTSVEDMWRHPGKKMVVVAGKNTIYRPLGVIKKGRVYLGRHFSTHSIMDHPEQAADVVISSTVVKPLLLSGRLYLPKDAQVFFVTEDASYFDMSLEKVASRSFPTRRVTVTRNHLGYSLSGMPVEHAEWEGEPLEKQAVSLPDAVFILGALGVGEPTALQKVAASRRGPQDLLVTRTLATVNTEYDVDLGFLKLAAALPQQQDELMALQLMGSETLDMFVKQLPALYALADSLAKLTLAAQIGLEPVDPDTAFLATKNVQKVADQLTQLDSMGAGQA